MHLLNIRDNKEDVSNLCIQLTSKDIVPDTISSQKARESVKKKNKDVQHGRVGYHDSDGCHHGISWSPLVMDPLETKPEHEDTIDDQTHSINQESEEWVKERI